MAHRKVDITPVRDSDPVKTKPGDFDPPLTTADPLVRDPPAQGEQGSSYTPNPETCGAESQ